MTTAATRPLPPGADLAFQAHFHAPPVPTTLQPPATSSPSLVRQGITHEHTPQIRCEDGRWLLAVCVAHGYERWIYRPCKKRTCPVCGLKRRKKVAWRIAQGIEQLGGEHGAGWFVGTWASDVEKPAAVKAVNRFVAWVRRQPGPRVEYASTWERTRRGRLHVNLILAPWTYLPSTRLSAAWRRVGGGPNVWIKRVGAGIGQEAAKSREGVARYFSKFEQMVPSGRAATYSRGWPKLPDSLDAKRRGEIEYIREDDRMPYQLPPAFDPNDIQLTLWQETHPGEYRNRHDPLCTCFQYVQPIDAASVRSPP